MTQEITTPQWMNTLVQKFSAGVAHGFILHFNVSDYVYGSLHMREALAALLVNREVVVFYNPSEGITFAQPSMQKRFMQLVGLDESEENEALAALGMATGNQQQQLPRAASAALPLLEKLLKLGNAKNSDKVAAVIIEYAETIAPDAEISMMSPDDRVNLVTLQRWGKDMQISATGNPIFLVTSNLSELHSAVRAASSKYESIEVPLPDYDARCAYIESSIQYGNYSFTTELTTSQLANATAGLSLVNIEDVLLRADQNGVLTADLVKERKDSIIASEYDEVIEVFDPRFGFEMIGGLQHVKDFFMRSVVNPIKAGNYKRVPMGVLMTGPAGTGKSAVAEAVARECGINAVKLNLAKIFAGVVGATERNLEKALRMIDSLSPTMVFIDEIDQSVQRNSGAGDSGVSSRVFKRLLEYMSDTGHRGKVVFLAATNRPDLLDAALRRPGRFDAKVPFLVPTISERASIFSVMCKRYEVACNSFTVSSQCVVNTDGWTGAEIEAAVVKAGQLAEDYDMQPEAALTEATLRLSPSTADIEFMTLIAVRECNDTDLLPDEWKAALANRKELDNRIDQTAPAEAQQRTGKRSF